MELVLGAAGADLPATLDLPSGPVRGALVPLHGASDGQRSAVLFEHLAAVLPGHGIAVLRYDRRPKVDGADVPLGDQAADAAAAVAELRRRVGDVPITGWGFSQGAWAALLTAAQWPELLSALVLVSACGVSPAAQMRYGTAVQLRRRGYAEPDVEAMLAARTSLEAYLRGERAPEPVQRMIDAVAGEPWFADSYLPRRLPPPGSWRDMDFDPAPVFARVRCPILACYGETDAWVPVDLSLSAWQRARAGSEPELTVVRLARCGHWPSPHDPPSVAAVSGQYTDVLTGWLTTVGRRP